MEVILSQNAGFCFGVKRAVDEAIKIRNQYNKRIYTLGPLIHNKDAVEYLKENEVYPIDLEDIDTLSQGDVILIRSHGVGPLVFDTLKDRGIIVINATCPYVSNIQQKVKKYYDMGYSVLIVGDKEHPEVIGINGWCNNSAIIAKSGSELEKLPKKVCVVSQTTEKQSNWESVLSYVVKNCKEIIAFNTICNATEVRQKAAGELSKEVDMMIVVGGFNSSNTTKLYEISKKNCPNTIHVENWSQVNESILNGKDINKVGVTAGASTPDWIIEEVINNMSNEQTTMDTNVENMEMNEQLAFMDQNDMSIVVGKVVKGTIISVNDKEAYVSLSSKYEGILPKAEVTRDDSVRLPDILKVDEEVEAKIIRRKNDDGYVVLSRVEIEKGEALKEIKAAFENGSALKVVVKEAVSGGLVASSRGVRIFIPASHIELFHIDNLAQYIGKELEVKLIEFKQERRGSKIIGSRRELMQGERDRRAAEAFETLTEGSRVVGEVKRLAAFGAFVDVNGVDGLLHVSELSYGRINKPSDLLKVGDKIEVYVLSVDKENKKVSLSLKRLSEDPWANIEEKYPVDNIVLGKVVRFADFGAFVELEPGVDGLVHISKISNKRIEKPGDALKIGEMVKAKIIEVNKETKKIGLSIRDVEEA
jgi:4-hydroxy-3-methylbut-2-enyl diphosphate reductase